MLPNPKIYRVRYAQDVSLFPYRIPPNEHSSKHSAEWICTHSRPFATRLSAHSNRRRYYFFINPTADQLAEIAVTTAKTFRQYTGAEPKVAMISCSTKGSAHDPIIDKVVEATAKAKEMDPSLLIDGELQFDAAIIPEIAAKKAPGSPVAGQANILVFPDLNCGNTMYKATERLAGATAIGPLIQGLRRPFTDVSRGCSVDDIVDCAAVAAITEWAD